MKRSADVLAVLLLAGCGGGGGPAPAAAPSTPPAPPPTTTTAPGPQAFLEWAHNAQLGTRSLKNVPDEPLLGLGNAVCRGLDRGLAYGGIVQGIVGSNTKPTAQQADEFARKAVENLCPQHKNQLP